MSSESVYVSYSWGAEEASRVVEKLEVACQQRGIELKRDKNHIGYGDSIRAYMDELAAGDHVILVLSEAYFKSEYCMYKLREIYRRGKDFRKRVYPIVLKGTPFQKPIARIPYLEHWEKETSQLQAALAGLQDPKHVKNARASLDDYDDFRNLMDELQAILADMNSLTQDVHVDTDFVALLNRLLPPLVQLVPRPKRAREPDARFRAKIIEEVRSVLTNCKSLRDALEAEVPRLGSSGSQDVSETLCTLELEQALDDLLRPAAIASMRGLDVHRQEFTHTWADAKRVLCWLSLLAVSDERIEELERRESATGDFSRTSVSRSS